MQDLMDFKSYCDLSIYKKEDFTYVIFTELKDNPGTSITNFIEFLATEIYH